MGKLKKILLIGLPLVAVLVALFFVVRGCQNSKTFTVTFDSNGGTKVKSQEVKLNEKVEEPDDPEKDGYEFKGWYLNGKKYNFKKKVTKDLKLKARWTKIDTTEDEEVVVEQPVVVTPTPVVSKKAPALKLNVPEVFYVNDETMFDLELIANDYKDTMVVGRVAITNSESLEKLEYLGKDENWHEFSLDDLFGGEEGFALTDGINPFKATFNEIGEYEVVVQLLSVKDKKVMAEAKATIVVEKKAAELTIEAEGPFYLNEESDVVVSVIANDDENVLVIGKAEISEPEALEKLEYLGKDEIWYEFSLEQDFGQSEGFELVDGSSEFKATFNKTGEYEVTVQLLNVEDGSVVAETTTVIEVIAKPVEISFDINEELVKDHTEEFTISLEANDYVGKKVIGKATITNSETLEKLEYLGADQNWYEITLDDVFGQPEGFELTEEIMSNDFRAIFNTAGTYEVTVQIIDVETEEVIGEKVKEITVREPIAPEIIFEAEDEFVVGIPQEFSISTKANEYEGLIVVGLGGLSNPEAIEKLEYYEVSNDTWYELPQDGNFGGAGFPLADATSKFRVTFKTAGTYTVEYAVADAETNEVVAENVSEITVRERIDAEITFDVPEEFVVGEATEFTVSTEANEYEGLMVVGTGGLSNPEAIEKLEYYEVNNDTWYELPAGSNFGPATGFPLANATSKFRVTFKTAGEYKAEFEVVNAETSDSVAKAETTLTVVDATLEQ